MKKLLSLLMIILVLLTACTDTTPTVTEHETEPTSMLPWAQKSFPYTVAGSTALSFSEGPAFGEYVVYRGALYLWQRAAADYALVNTALDRAEANCDTAMLCIRQDSTVSVLRGITGNGNFYIYQDTLYAVADGEIFCADLTGQNKKTIADGCLLAAEGDVLICQNDALGLFSVELSSGRNSIMPLSLNARFLTLDEGKIYYQELLSTELASKGKVLLNCINADGTEEQLLCESRADLTSAPMQETASIIELKLSKTNIYFSYGFLCDDAPYGIMRVGKDGIGAERLDDGAVRSSFFVVEGTMADTLYYFKKDLDGYAVKNLTTNETDETALPGIAPLTPYQKDGAVYFLDSTGAAQTLLTAEELFSMGLTAAIGEELSSSYRLYLLSGEAEQSLIELQTVEENKLVHRALLLKDRQTEALYGMQAF